MNQAIGKLEKAWRDAFTLFVVFALTSSSVGAPQNGKDGINQKTEAETYLDLANKHRGKGEQTKELQGLWRAANSGLQDKEAILALNRIQNCKSLFRPDGPRSTHKNRAFLYAFASTIELYLTKARSGDIANRKHLTDEACLPLITFIKSVDVDISKWPEVGKKDWPIAWSTVAEFQEWAGLHVKADKTLGELMAIDPNNAEWIFKRAEHAERLNNSDKALQHYSKAITCAWDKHNKWYLEAIYNLGRLNLELGNNDDLLRRWSDIIDRSKEIQPYKSAYTQDQLKYIEFQTALAEQNAGNQAEAKDRWIKYIEKYAEDRSARIWHSLNLINLYEYSSAEETLGFVLEATAEDTDDLTERSYLFAANNNLGHCLQARNQLDAAESAFIKSIKFSDRFPPSENNRASIPYKNLGYLLSGLGRHREAVPYLKSAAHLSEREWHLYYQLGLSASAAGDPSLAKISLGEAVSLTSDFRNPVTFADVEYGKALIQQGEIHKAIPVFKKVTQFYPVWPEAYYHLGFCLWSCKKRNEARTQLAKLRTIPGSEDWTRKLARVIEDRASFVLKATGTAVNIDFLPEVSCGQPVWTKISTSKKTRFGKTTLIASQNQVVVEGPHRLVTSEPPQSPDKPEQQERSTIHFPEEGRLTVISCKTNLGWAHVNIQRDWQGIRACPGKGWRFEIQPNGSPDSSHITIVDIDLDGKPSSEDLWLIDDRRIGIHPQTSIVLKGHLLEEVSVDNLLNLTADTPVMPIHPENKRRFLSWNEKRLDHGIPPGEYGYLESNGCVQHANYVETHQLFNAIDGSNWFGLHAESSELPGFTPDGHSAGMSSCVWPGDSKAQLDGYIHTLYHRPVLFDPEFRTLRLGGNSYAFLYGVSWDSRSTATYPILFPAPQSVVRGGKFTHEWPRHPIERCVKEPGLPITVKPKSTDIKSAAGSLSHVTTNTSQAHSLKTISTHLSWPGYEAPIDKPDNAGVIALTPHSPLLPGMYQAEISWEDRSGKHQASWRFTISN